MRGALLEILDSCSWGSLAPGSQREGPQVSLSTEGSTGFPASPPGTVTRGCPRIAACPVTDTCVFAGKVWVPKQKPMDPVLESVTLEPELEEALANASDAELCDIAGKSLSGSFPHIFQKGLTCPCRES